MRRPVRLVPLALAALVVLTGCGTEGPDRARPAGARTASTSATTPAPTPAAEQPAAAPGIPDDFPLGAGLRSDGETTVEGPGADVPGAYLEDLCGFTGWPGAVAGRVDRLAVRQSGPELLVVRELVAYDSDGSATAVLDQLRDQVDACPRADGQLVTSLDEEVEPDTREDSVTYTMTYRQGLGGTVVQVTRAGHDLLATTWGGEYSLDSAIEAVPALTRTSHELLGRLTRGPDATGVTFTPGGAAPFRMGMTVDQAQAAASGVRIESPAGACPQLSWTDPSGVLVRGTFSPGVGLAYLSAEGGATREGVAVGDSLAGLRAAYPNLAHADNGTWYSQQGATAYVFDVEPGGGAIRWIMVAGDDQVCAG